MTEKNKYDIAVTARTQFVAEQSDVVVGRYVFSYTITIHNKGLVAAQLVSRHWLIADDNDFVQEVRGLGVVGQQPLLPPEGKFEYTSGCVLATPGGSMRGTYHFTAEDGTQFEAQIPDFFLSMPRVLH